MAGASGIPVDVVCELRGVAPASEFTARDTGEVVRVPAKAKFEYELPNGDVGVLEVSGTQLQKATGSFDLNTADRGERVRLLGVVRDGERGSYVQLVAADVYDESLA